MRLSASQNNNLGGGGGGGGGRERENISQFGQCGWSLANLGGTEGLYVSLLNTLSTHWLALNIE